jgi:hypothetical protein
MQYGQQLDLAARSEIMSTEIQSKEYAARKEKADAEIAEMKAERMRREENRYWLHAEEAWSDIAAVLIALRDSIRHHLYTGQREIVHHAAGNQDHSQEVFEATDALVSTAFNEISEQSLAVTFERDIKNEDPKSF